MARKKNLSFSREEVEYVSKSVAAGVLQNVLTSLLHSGAQPDPKIGALIMHYSNGVRELHEDANTASINLMASISPADDERFSILQEIVGEQIK